MSIQPDPYEPRAGLFREAQQRAREYLVAASENVQAGRRSSNIPQLRDEERSYAAEIIGVALEGVASQLTRARAAKEALKEPMVLHVRTAIARDGRTLTAMREIAGFQIMNPGRGPQCPCGPLELLQHLRGYATSRKNHERRIEVLTAYRWWWLNLGSELGLTQTELGRLAGITKPAVQKQLKASEEKQRANKLLLIGPHAAGVRLADSELARIAEDVMLRRLVKDHKDAPGAIHSVAWLLAAREHPGAKAAYAASANHGIPCSAHNLAMRLVEEGDREAAEHWFEQSFSLSHRCANALHYPKWLIAEGRLVDARVAYERAAELRIPGAHAALAEFLEQQDDRTAADEWYLRGADVGAHTASTSVVCRPFALLVPMRHAR